MAKWAIVDKFSGALTDIVDVADKFEIYEGADAELKWCEVPDDTTYEHAMINGVVVHRSENEDLREDAVVERILGYGDQGEQMDMLYRDIAAGKAGAAAATTIAKPFKKPSKEEELKKEKEEKKRKEIERKQQSKKPKDEHAELRKDLFADYR